MIIPTIECVNTHFLAWLLRSLWICMSSKIQQCNGVITKVIETIT